jgi:hypothetical protein
MGVAGLKQLCLLSQILRNIKIFPGSGDRHDFNIVILTDFQDEFENVVCLVI